MSRWRFTLVVVLAGLLVPEAARAMPAFARRYQVSCQTCHALAWPELNPFGRRFKENGYQYPAGAEEAYRAEEADRPPGSLLDIFRQPPVGVRAQVAATAAVVPSLSSRRADLFVPIRADLIAGGSLAPDVSVLAALSLAPSLSIPILAVGLHNLGGPGVLNLRAGRFIVHDFMRPSHRGVTLLGSPAEAVRVGGNPFALGDHQMGLHAWGRPGLGPWFWEVAVVQGVEDATTGRDVDLWKDVYVRTTVDLGAHRLGLLGYAGNVVLRSDLGGILREFTDPHSLLGVEVELVHERARLFGLVLFGYHANPRGLNDGRVRYFSARLQGDLPLGDSVLAVVRADSVYSPDAAELTRHFFTLHGSYLLTPGVRVGAEATYALKTQSEVSFSLLVDAGF